MIFWRYVFDVAKTDMSYDERIKPAYVTKSKWEREREREREREKQTDRQTGWDRQRYRGK